MILADVNVLIYAFDAHAEFHEQCREWLKAVLEEPEPYAMSPQVLCSFLRITTHPALHQKSAPMSHALRFVNALLEPEHCQIAHPGPRHWKFFRDLCRQPGIRGNLVQDAWFAALAMEHNCEWITFDRDYARFAGLRWGTPRLSR